mgnify:CR=1 FL=1
MEIIVKVDKAVGVELCKQDFSESLLSSVECALLVLKQKKNDLQKFLFRLMDSKGSWICAGNEQGYAEQLSFFTRRLGEVSDAYSDLSQLYLFLSKDGV